MKQQFQFAAKALMLALGFIFLQSFFSRGGDYYKVLLSGRLVTEQYLTQPVSMKTLSLTPHNSNDRLTVYYSHCGAAGKGRSVSIRNHSGTVLKEWKFVDSKSMELQLPVKDILNASSKNNSLFLYYASQEIPSGKRLLAINLSGVVAKL